ncbi:MAG: hypothetical protein MI753_07035 [Hyphomicrobiales bacterium]|nr:hypothetical protein [Hyphomicrobiales bacterium]
MHGISTLGTCHGHAVIEQSCALALERAEALVARYTADNGYINAFFNQYLFADPGGLLLSAANRPQKSYFLEFSFYLFK